MKTSEAGKNNIKAFEGLRLDAYKCSAGVPTIGYGHTLGVSMGDKITQTQADDMLTGDLVKFENSINSLVKAPLNQNQFDALVSFVFNVGSAAFKNSTLLRKLNTGDYTGAANEFKRWNKVNGVPNNGLTRRRKAEEDMFNGN